MIVMIWLAPWAGKINHILRCNWLLGWARQKLSWPLGTSRCVLQEEFTRKPYNKSFIDQVCSVKMPWYWPRSFFASLRTLTLSRSINTQYPAMLTFHLVNNPYLLINRGETEIIPFSVKYHCTEHWVVYVICWIKQRTFVRVYIKLYCSRQVWGKPETCQS